MKRGQQQKLNINGDDEQSNSAVTLARKSKNNSTSYVAEPPVEYDNPHSSSSDDEDEHTASTEQTGSDLEDEVEEFSPDNSEEESEEERSAHYSDDSDEDDDAAGAYQVDGSFNSSENGDDSDSSEVPEAVRDNVRMHIFQWLLSKFFAADTILPMSMLRVLARAATTISVLIEPLYSGFLWLSAVQAINETFKAYSGSEEGLSEDVLGIIAVSVFPLVLANLFSDMSSVDPLTEADELTFGQGTSVKSKIAKVFGRILIVQAAILSFPIGAAADAIPVSSLMHKALCDPAGINCEDLALINIVQYGALIGSSFFGTLYYLMFNRRRIYEHMDALIDIVKDIPAFLKRVWHDPGKYGEVVWQTILNALYRGISFGYTIQDVLNVFTGISPNSPAVLTGVALTFGSTALTTMTSRVMAPHRAALPHQYHDIHPQAWQMSSGFKKGGWLVFDIGLTFGRAFTAACLSGYFIPGSEAVKYTVATLAAAVVVAHGLWFNYSVNRINDAIEITKKIADGMFAHLPQSSNVIELNESSPHAFSPLWQGEDEETRLLLPAAALLEDDELPLWKRMENHMALFNQLAHDNLSTAAKFLITLDNTGARFIRLIAFYLFVKTLAETFGLDLPDNLILVTAFGWAAEIFKNDGKVFQGAMEGTISRVKASHQIETVMWQKEHSGNKAGLFRNGLFLSKALLKSPYDYSADAIQTTIEKLEAEKVAKKRGLLPWMSSEKPVAYSLREENLEAGRRFQNSLSYASNA